MTSDLNLDNESLIAKNYDEVYIKNFFILKSQVETLQDASRKSSIDIRIRNIVDSINNSENYFTTSSCSGRFIVFSQDEVFVKKNCEWIKVSHDPLDENEIEELIKKIEEEKLKNTQMFMKFEPFILHVACRTLSHAKRMLEQCIASGYRNSGISLGSSKIILAVRSTQNLECPISNAGKLLVDHEYIKYICNYSNDKFKENFERIERFYRNIETNCLNSDTSINVKEVKKLEKAKQREEKRAMFEKIKTSKEKISSPKEVVEMENNYECLSLDFNEMFEKATQ